jgi:conjugative relaxase-like TrwC/TraI family protein
LATLHPGAEDYLEQQVARGLEEYYLGVKEAPGEWMGGGAERLGLDGEVDGEAFRRVLSHADPLTGVRLTTGRSQPKVVGFDATFCAPKSVSLLYALGRGEVSNEVRNAHDRAVRTALEFYEQVAQGRRGKAGCTLTVGDGFVAAAYRHRTSRAAEPHLHTHVVIANLVHAEADGRWTALDGRPLFSWARTVGHLYNAHLRAELTTRLGVDWKPVKNGLADIWGFSRMAIEAFSTRRRQIEAAMDRAGVHSAKAAQTAAYSTRAAKDLSLDAATLVAHWQALAAEHGLTPSALNRLLGAMVAPFAVPVPGSPEAEALYRRLASPNGLTAQRSTFDARQVIEATCELLPHGARVDQVLALTADFLASTHVCVIDGPELAPEGSLRRADRRLVPSADGLCRYTTPEMIRTERHLLKRAVLRRGEGVVVPSVVVDAVMARRPELSAEQVAMARRLCLSGDGVEVVRGIAGAGKTFALGAAAEAFSKAGHHVTGCALAAKAAAGLEDATGIASMSIDRLLHGLASGRLELSPGEVIVADEAAMIGTRKLHDLLDHAAQARAKVILIGDPCQLPEIEAGGAFEALERTLGASALTENRRQRAAWERGALQRLRDGDVEVALDAYRRMGRLHEHENVRSWLVSDWVAARREGADAVMLATTLADVDDLNDRARAALREHGRLGRDEIVLSGRGFAVGDQVLALRNDYPRGVLNGTRLTVDAVDLTAGELRGVDELDRRVTIDFAYVEAGHLAHAYAMTVHKAQGATVDRALVLARPEAFTAELGYTALSRARARTDLYLETLVVERETHSRPAQAAPGYERIAEALRQTRREPLAIDQAGTRLQPIAAMRAERDQILRQLDPQPADHSHRLAQLDQEIRLIRETRDQAVGRIGHAERRLRGLGRVGRRLHPREARELERRVGASRGVVDECRSQLALRAGEHRNLTAERRILQRWESLHAAELERLRHLDSAIRITEGLERSRARTLSRTGLERTLGLSR